MNNNIIIIPLEWNLVRFEEIIRKIKRGESKKTNLKNKGVIYLTSEYIRENRIVWENLKHIETDADIRPYLIHKYDLILNCVNSLAKIGKVAIFYGHNEPVVVGFNNFAITINERKAESEYLRYFFESHRGKIEIHRASKPAINQVSFSSKDTYRMRIVLPSLEEQNQIVSILSIVDNIIHQTQQLINNLQLLKKGLLQKLFTQGIEHTEFKETKIGRIPKEWKVSNLGKLGNFQYGYTTSATNENTKIKFIRITDINENGFVDWDKVPYAFNIDFNKEKYSLHKGDVLIARIGATTGKTCYIEEEMNNVVFASYLIRFQTKKEILAKFLFYFTQNITYDKQIYQNKDGKLKKGINAQELRSFLIPIPRRDEQDRIVKIFENIDYFIKHETNNKTKYMKSKKGLMQDLLTGKKRVSTAAN